MDPDSGITAPADQRPHTQALPVMVSVEYQGSLELARCLSKARAPLGPVLSWGKHSTFHYMFEHSPPMLLLDLPRPTSPAHLAGLVRALSLVGKVVVLGPQELSSLAAFDAGAYNVLDRRAPAVELAARMRADVRRCRFGARPTLDWRGGHALTQRLLFRLMAQAATPLCCHDLCLLLGNPDRPLTLRALKARVQRLLPAFEAEGIAVSAEMQWRRAVFEVHRAASNRYLA